MFPLQPPIFQAFVVQYHCSVFPGKLPSLLNYYYFLNLQTRKLRLSDLSRVPHFTSGKIRVEPISIGE